jgi:hypothetical protein
VRREKEPVANRWDFCGPLHLRLRISWQLAGILLAAHGGAAICLLITALPPWIAWLAMLAVALHLVYALSQHAFRCTRTAITELTLADKAQVQLVTGGGQPINAVLLGGYSQLMLSVLRLRLGPWRRRSVVLLPDMLEPDRLRKLRVYLRRLGSAIHSDNV